jgi:hypothetical protein
MKSYVGIDLHSTNCNLGIINGRDKRVLKKKLPNDPKPILEHLAPRKKEIQGIVVESTFNWYWLVDLLMDNGYQVHLANPSAIQQYKGLKHSLIGSHFLYCLCSEPLKGWLITMRFVSDSWIRHCTEDFLAASEKRRGRQRQWMVCFVARTARYLCSANRRPEKESQSLPVPP